MTGHVDVLKDWEYRRLGRRASWWFFGLAVPFSVLPIVFGTGFLLGFDHGEESLGLLLPVWFFTAAFWMVGINWLVPTAVSWFLRVRASRDYRAAPRDREVAARAKAVSDLELRWTYIVGPALFIGFRPSPRNPPVARTVNRVVISMWVVLVVYGVVAFALSRPLHEVSLG